MNDTVNVEAKVKEAQKVIRDSLKKILSDAKGDVGGFATEMSQSVESVMNRIVAGDPSAKKDLRHLKAQSLILAQKYKIRGKKQVMDSMYMIVQLSLKTMIAALT